MDIRHLEALVAVSEQGTFSAAADALSTVQSNISGHVARLERELGVILVDRNAGKLTPDGEMVVTRAYRVLGELEALHADLAARGEEVAGTVRVGIIGTAARWLVPLLLRQVSERHPKLKLLLTDGTTPALETQMSAGRLDFAVLTFPVPGRDVVFEPLFEEDLLLVVPAGDDRLDGQTRITLEDLEGAELIMPAPGTQLRAELDSALVPAGIHVQAIAELDGVRLLASLASEGIGPAIVPATAAPTQANPGFRVISVEGLPRRRVGLAMRSRALPSPPVRAVAHTVQSLFIAGDSLPEGLYPVVPLAASRAEGSLRLMTMPND